MFRIYLVNKVLVVYDKSEKEFREKYGNSFEQISVVKDQDNIEPVTNKLKQTYKATDVLLDCKIKKKFGWKFWDKETQELIRKKISEALKNYEKTEEHRANLSKGLKHVKNFKGKKHTEETKARLAWANKGKNPIKNKKWMYNPITGEERRAEELLPGMIWGRNPELKDRMLYARQFTQQSKKKAKNL